MYAVCFLVLTLQQNVLSKNLVPIVCTVKAVLTLQQNVLSKNARRHEHVGLYVLTLQQNVLSKNLDALDGVVRGGFDFTTKCSF